MENELTVIKQSCPKCGSDLADYSGCTMYDDGLREWRTPCTSKHCNYISVSQENVKMRNQVFLSKSNMRHLTLDEIARQVHAESLEECISLIDNLQKSLEIKNILSESKLMAIDIGLIKLSRKLISMLRGNI